MDWPPSRVKVLDGDLGQSGAQMTQREDFNLLVAEVSMQRVGAVLALEASRLSRSCADWQRLLELCALTGTLIVGEDGTYDPAQFNDQLLLGLKATMSRAELHFLRVRLLGGKRNKAKRCEPRFPLPVEFSYDDESRPVLGPDEEIRGLSACSSSALPRREARMRWFIVSPPEASVFRNGLTAGCGQGKSSGGN